MVKSVKITPDGRIAEVSEKEEEILNQGRVWDGRSLLVPELWGNDRRFRLTLTFPDMFEETDAYNPLATMLLCNLRHPKFKSVDVICGTAFLSNENLTKVVDFTKADLQYVLGTPEIRSLFA